MRPTVVGVQKAIDMPCRARKAIKSSPIHTDEQPSVKAKSSAYPSEKNWPVFYNVSHRTNQ